MSEEITGIYTENCAGELEPATNANVLVIDSETSKAEIKKFADQIQKAVDAIDLSNPEAKGKCGIKSKTKDIPLS